MGHGRDAGHVQDVAARVAEGLAEERLGLRADGGPPLVEVVRVLHERGLHAHLRQRVLEQVLRAAVEGGGDHHVVPRPGDVEDREGGGGLPGGQQQGARAALEGRDLLLHRLLGGVADARVERVQVCEREAVRRHLGGREVEGRGLHDRQGGGAVGVGLLGAGVDLAGLEAPALGAGGLGGRVLGGRVLGGVLGAHAADSWAVRVGHAPASGPLRTGGVHGSRTPVRERAHDATALAVPRSGGGLVVTRGTPPRWEGCRPACRGTGAGSRDRPASLTPAGAGAHGRPSWISCPASHRASLSLTRARLTSPGPTRGRSS